MSEETSFKIFDELDVRHHAEISNLVGTDERVLFSGTVMKINKYRNSQERILVITDKYLYNICLSGNILNNFQNWLSPKSALKRKIEVKNISEITVSTHPRSDEFIIHVTNDYDYRYDGKAKRERVVQAICAAHFLMGKNTFGLYLKEPEDLAAFQTTDDDFKAHIIKKPNDAKISINKELCDKGLEYIIVHKDALILGSNENSPTSKVRSFEPSKPITSIEDIPLTISGLVPQSSLIIVEQGTGDLKDKLL